MLSRRRTVLLAGFLAMYPAPTDAEPYTPKPGEILHLNTATTGKTDGGTDLRLPPGYFLDEPTFTAKDLELRSSQETITRLKGENESFRKTTKSWQPGWKTLTTSLLVGLAGGWYIHSKIN